MKLYSDYPVHRIRQVTADVCAVVAIWFIVAAARALGDRINAFKQLGVRMEDSGAGFRSTMTDIGDSLSGVPLIGDGISKPFAAAAKAGADLQSAGIEQQSAVGDLAINVAVSVALLPLTAIALLWLVPRVRFAWRAARARKLLGQPGAIELLALRAMLTVDPATILRTIDEPAAAWRAGNPAAMRALASLELRSTGVAVGEPSRSTP